MKLDRRIIALLLASLCIGTASCSKQKNDTSNDGDGQAVTDNVQSNEAPAKDEDMDKEAAKVKENSEKAQKVLSTVPEYPDTFPTLEDAKALYDGANMALGWIISTEKVATYDNDTIEYNGIAYKRVRPDCFYGAHALEHHGKDLGNTQKLIYDLESLEAYLCTLISPDEAELYMDDAVDLKKFTEDEAGNLYVLDFTYTPEGYGEEETYTLTDNGDGSYDFTVNYTLVNDEGEVYRERSETFPLVQIDGRWVFEDFRVIKQ